MDAVLVGSDAVRIVAPRGCATFFISKRSSGMIKLDSNTSGCPTPPLRATAAAGEARPSPGARTDKDEALGPSPTVPTVGPPPFAHGLPIPTRAVDVPRAAAAQAAVARMAAALDLDVPGVLLSAPQRAANAWAGALPDGRAYIMIEPSLFERVSAETMQFILAHEVGHLCVRQARGCAPFRALGISPEALRQMLDRLPRQHELAADWLAMQVVGRAQAIGALRTGHFAWEPSDTQHDARLLTHPPTAQRVANLMQSHATYLHLPEHASEPGAALRLWGAPSDVASLLAPALACLLAVLNIRRIRGAAGRHRAA
jgi:hypothetical protein